MSRMLIDLGYLRATKQVKYFQMCYTAKNKTKKKHNILTML